MLEPEMEAFLLRLVPGLADEWEGATDEEIRAIEVIAGQPLPRFYRWFLARMGRDAGPLEEPFAAFSARAVLSAYESGDAPAEADLLLLARIDDPFMPLEVYYDLSRRIREDALVVTAQGGELSNAAETLREWMAWATLIKARVHAAPQRCRGWFSARSGDLAEPLSRTLAELGFTRPIPSGRFCAVYERPDAALACKVEVEEEHSGLLIFNLGGADPGTLRRILGEIAASGEVEVEISAWTPPLPG